MKRSLIFATALCAISPIAAFAGGGNDGNMHGRDPAPQPTSTYNASANMRQLQGQYQTATGGNATGGRASAAGGSGGNAAGGSGGQAYNEGNSYSGGSYSSSYSARGNTPDAIAPSIVGGNTCAVGGSAALSLAGLGIGGGFSGEGEKCNARQIAAILILAHHEREGFELLCKSDANLQQTMVDLGTPCMVTQAAWRKEGYHQRQDGYWVR